MMRAIADLQRKLSLEVRDRQEVEARLLDFEKKYSNLTVDFSQLENQLHQLQASYKAEQEKVSLVKTCQYLDYKLCSSGGSVLYTSEVRGLWV